MSNNLHFKLTVKDCLVKVTYITNEKTDYRIGVIQDVIEKEESYKVNFKGGSKTMNHYLLVKISDEVKEFKLVFISNKELDERELYKWIKELELSNQKKPTIGEIEEKK
jgi:hypothetical protein